MNSLPLSTCADTTCMKTRSSRVLLGNVVGRMAHPASERETLRCLSERSGWGSWLGADFETGSMTYSMGW